jgi:integrase
VHDIVGGICKKPYYTGCRISEALALTPRRVDIGSQTIIFESLKKRRRGLYRAVLVP